MSTYINQGSTPCSEVGLKFYKGQSHTSDKLIALMVGKGVSTKVEKFRDTNRTANRGLKKMEHKAFLEIHKIKD